MFYITGLTPNCQTILYTDLQVRKHEDIQFIDCQSTISIDYIDLPKDFKCMAADSIQPIELEVSVNNAPEDSKVFVKIEAHSLPTVEEYLLYCYFELAFTTKQNIFFEPSPNTWHYLTIGELKGNISAVANCESYLRTEDDIENNTILELMRDDKGRFFTYDFGVPTTDIQDATSVLNVTSDAVTTYRFKVNQFHDIGGSLTIETSLLMSLKYYMGYTRSLTDGVLEFSAEHPYIKVVICMDVGHASVPLVDGQCRYNDRITPALFSLNSTDSESVYDKIIIPYPDSGVWYLSFRLFCDSTVCPCKTSTDGKKYYVNPNAIDRDDFKVVSANDTRVGESQCNASIVLSISSNTCVGGRCLNRGNCLLNTFGGMVMSYCQCSSGFGGENMLLYKKNDSKW